MPGHASGLLLILHESQPDGGFWHPVHLILLTGGWKLFLGEGKYLHIFLEPPPLGSLSYAPRLSAPTRGTQIPALCLGLPWGQAGGVRMGTPVRVCSHKAVDIAEVFTGLCTHTGL